MESIGHPASLMSDALRRHVERELLRDLAHYRPAQLGGGLTVDWSNPCQEGHCVKSLGGLLESMSDVAVRDQNGNVIADGWVDFVRAGSNPPFVFWLFLHVVDENGARSVKETNEIPAHVWLRLPNEVKDECVAGDDPSWRGDPQVVAWLRRS
jgi:hypothetical protein